MAEFSSLGYVVLGVKDLARWEQFATGILGLMPGRRGSGELALRMDEHAQRILLVQADDDDITAAGWQFDTNSELEAYIENLSSKVTVRKGDRVLAESRQVERVFITDDPNGFTHEFYYGPTYASISTPFHSPLLKGKAFETGRLGMGHIVPIARDYAQSVQFYRDVLGLRISDYIRDSHSMPGVTADATFFHTRTGRHHSLATLQAPFPKRIHHVMVQVKDMDDVGLAYDRCLKAGLPIHASLGHHPNDHMFSFYVGTPSGFAVEFGHGGIVVDDASWEIKNYTQLSDWGHHNLGQPPAA